MTNRGAAYTRVPLSHNLMPTKILKKIAAALQQAEIPETKKQKSQADVTTIMHTQKPPSQRLHHAIAAQN